MDPPKPKRVRATNWDSSDKILLRQLIEDKISIIENKNCDTNTSRMKKDACREITTNFNNISSTMRETAQLQAQWRGTKMKAKMTVSAYKKQLSATGGGPPPKSPEPEHEKLMALIPHEFEEDDNKFDCDTEIKENIPYNKQEAKEIRKSPMDVSNDYDDIVFLEETPPKNPSPPPAASPTPSRLNPKKKKKNLPTEACREDEKLKQELFELAMENRRAEKQYMEKEHEEKIKTILMERSEILKKYEMERIHKEEIHLLKLKMLKEQNLSYVIQ